jgi:hypothetical protein
VKLGTFPEMTVEQARIEAQKILAEFAAGANPAAARRATREEQTFAEMLMEMLKSKKKRDGSPISTRTKKDYLDTARLHMGAIANCKLSHVLRSDVKSIHSRASKKSPHQADKAVAIISSVFNTLPTMNISAAQTRPAECRKTRPPPEIALCRRMSCRTCLQPWPSRACAITSCCRCSPGPAVQTCKKWRGVISTWTLGSGASA